MMGVYTIGLRKNMRSVFLSLSKKLYEQNLIPTAKTMFLFCIKSMKWEIIMLLIGIMMFTINGVVEFLLIYTIESFLLHSKCGKPIRICLKRLWTKLLSNIFTPMLNSVAIST